MTDLLKEQKKGIDPKSIKITASKEKASPPDVANDPPESDLVRKNQIHHLDAASPLDPNSFPNPPDSGHTRVAPTIPNVAHLLNSYGIRVHHDVIRKKLKIVIPGVAGSPENVDSTALSTILSLAVLNNMSTGLLPAFVEVLGDRSPINPVADWITSEPWDGVDRLSEFYNTLEYEEGYPVHLRDRLIYRWLISAVAAVMKPSGFRSRGVLTLAGPQSIGKTAWIKSLVTDPILNETLIKLDHHLDAGNKDSQITAISHWIVEIGELDSSFKKDIARLKGFITSDVDKVRRPYGKTDSEYPRRTVFCATVNDENFLVDDTGNTRWWTIRVKSINYEHSIDMQQVFAQIHEEYKNGERWWLDEHEEALLESVNKDFRKVSAIRESVLEVLDLDQLENEPHESFPYLTAKEVLAHAEIDRPSNLQFKDCHAVLREHLGQPKKIKGLMKWRVPLKDSKRSYNQQPFTKT